jgi:predicted amidohydrolase
MIGRRPAAGLLGARSAALLAAVVLAWSAAEAAGVKCAIVQFSDRYPDEVTKDADRLEAYVRTAASNGAKLVVAPENCLHRYSVWEQNGVTQLDLANHFDGLVSRFSGVASELGVCLVFGLREPSGDGTKPTYQSAVYIDHGGTLLKTYRKRVPSNSEKGYTKSGGNDWSSFATPYGRCFMQICKDMDGDGYVSSMPTDIDLLIGVNKDPNRGWVKVDAGCKKVGCYGIGANYAGSSTHEGGNSGFVDPNGNMISEAGSGNNGQNETIIYEILPLPTSGNGPPAISSVSASPNPAAAGETVSFVCSASDPDADPLSYAWDFGDGGSATGSSATHAYSSAGSYTAKVTVSDGKGHAVSGSVTVEVSEAPTRDDIDSLIRSHREGAAGAQEVRDGIAKYRDRPAP